jgi:hypothetical protein
MQVLRRLVTSLAATAVIVVLVGCGGLGVNIGSGPSRGSNVVNLVSIQVQSGPNVPNVLRGHTILMTAIAYYFFGGQNYVSATQGAIFTTPAVGCDSAKNTMGEAVSCGDIIRFMDPQCQVVLTSTSPTGPVANPAGVTFWWTTTVPSQTACVLGVNPGSAKLYATVNGVTGVVTVTVL